MYSSVLALIVLPMMAMAAGKVPAKSQDTIFGCTATTYTGAFFQKQGDNILGYGVGNVESSFEDCVGSCITTDGCKAVNWVGGKSCMPFKTGVTDIDKQINKDVFSKADSNHVTLNCPEPKASGPVGCGKQAAAYQPTIGKAANLRIIGGNEAKPHSWPWQVYLMAASENASSGSYSACGASLIRVRDDKEESDILVTAGHCVTYGDLYVKPILHTASKISGVLGNHDVDHYDAGEQTRVAATVITHPQYVQPHNDIAIVKLAVPIKFTDTIRPICLPKQDEALPVGKKCAAAGWGRISSDPNSTDTGRRLKQLAVNVYSDADCKKNTVAGWGGQYIASENVCAGTLKGDEGVCKGDSGGMLACESSPGTWTLYGVASFVRDLRCAVAGYPGMFARVSSYVNFINESVKKLSTV